MNEIPFAYLLCAPIYTELLNVMTGFGDCYGYSFGWVDGVGTSYNPTGHQHGNGHYEYTVTTFLSEILTINFTVQGCGDWTHERYYGS